jgi:hypothetical protein
VRVRIRIGDVGIIRGVKPGEDVRGLVSARWAGQWSRPIEGSFFEVEVARIYLPVRRRGVHKPLEISAGQG